MNRPTEENPNPFQNIPDFMNSKRLLLSASSAPESPPPPDIS